MLVINANAALTTLTFVSSCILLTLLCTCNLSAQIGLTKNCSKTTTCLFPLFVTKFQVDCGMVNTALFRNASCCFNPLKKIQYPILVNVVWLALVYIIDCILLWLLTLLNSCLTWIVSSPCKGLQSVTGQLLHITDVHKMFLWVH